MKVKYIMKYSNTKIGLLFLYSIIIIGVSITTLVFNIMEIINQFKSNNETKWRPLLVLLLPYSTIFLSLIINNKKIIQIYSIIINLATIGFQLMIIKEKDENDRFKSIFVASFLIYNQMYNLIMSPKNQENALLYIDKLFKYKI